MLFVILRLTLLVLVKPKVTRLSSVIVDFSLVLLYLTMAVLWLDMLNRSEPRFKPKKTAFIILHFYIYSTKKRKKLSNIDYHDNLRLNQFLSSYVCLFSCMFILLFVHWIISLFNWVFVLLFVCLCVCILIVDCLLFT